MTDDATGGVSIDRLSSDDILADPEILNSFEQARQPHREDRHSFYLLESGTVHMEIDFHKYRLKQSTIIYVHPDQVHRILSFKDVTVIAWGITNESLDPDYLKTLQDMAPVRPLVLNKEMFMLFRDSATLFMKLPGSISPLTSQSILKDCCNVLVGMAVSQYAAKPGKNKKHSRFETVARAFRAALEKDYRHAQRPGTYARQLNISESYLNECVKETTGYPVTYHIQQRVILEAKRLLFHSEMTVKEISASLGFTDHSYFTRLFTKVAKVTPVAFRNKNRD